MEIKASGLVKNYRALISLKSLMWARNDLDKMDLGEMIRSCISVHTGTREPPVAPAAFASTLEAGVASGAIKFTNSGDVGLVATIYGKAFAAEMAAAVSLSYHGLGWDDAQMLAVCEALRAAHAGGGLRKLEDLTLAANEMGDGAMAALVALLEEGAMPNLAGLMLSSNQISDAGAAALASALRGGALPSCYHIDLGGNPGSDAPVKEALASPERAAALARRQDALSA